MTDALPIGLELGWIERDLRALDRAGADVLVGACFDDDSPPRGAAGLVDWRLGARLSRLCLGGFLTGAIGERLLLPARPRLPFDKVLLVGLGPRATFDEQRYLAALSDVLDALDGLRVRRAAIELPGRHAAAIGAQRALELLLIALGQRPAQLEALSVVDDREAQRFVEAIRARPARRNPEARR
ncbi:MAG: leucyl aminopeptidase [Deltaproteobacteria bacterium]|nr:leucyl aminopeptidase [Deltaproteobacteria bacterium]